MDDFADIRFRDLEFFGRLAALGSITGTADEMGIPKATASRWLAQLEERVGVLLVKRTPRGVTLTERGKEFAQRARDLLLDAHATRASLQSDEPGGTLRVSVPVPMGRMLAGPVIARFRRRLPNVRLEIRLQNERVDLLDEGIDLAIRGGSLSDSDLLTRKLSAASMWLYAGARYRKETLEDIPLIASPGDEKLLRRCIGAEVTASVVVDDRTAVADALIWGAGMGLLPSFLGEPGVSDESLWRIIEEPIVALPIHALYHHSHRDDARVEILIEEIQEQLSTLF